MKCQRSENMVTWIIAGVIMVASILADIVIRLIDYIEIRKWRNRDNKKSTITWEEYTQTHKYFICGIDNKKCTQDCLMNGIWEKEGCRYLKGYKGY